MSSSVQASEFGPFALFVQERRLMKQGAPVQLGSRALDILIMLVENAGNVVTKQQLIDHVWSGVTVEESSLRVHVAGLRKALGDGREGARYVTNIAGRGYCFVAAVDRRTNQPDAIATALCQPDILANLPRRSNLVVGRESEVSEIASIVQSRRFVTIHGPGGIGKTTVALSVASQLAGTFPDGVQFMDLSMRKSDVPVVESLACVLNLLQSGSATSNVVNYLRERRMLVVLDCCEHVVDSAAELAELICQEAPGVAVLTTSREALRADGEHVYPLASLAFPPDDAVISAETIANYPAARLFLERAVAAGYRAEFSDADAEIVADICRKVDGIALAVELTAARVTLQGLRETAAQLGGRLNLLWQGRRTALPRHQTLSATLDWSYELLDNRERTVLRRLSVFVGQFMLEETQVVAAGNGVDDAQVVQALVQLVSKSLVVADSGDGRTRYRILDTTRAYARLKLIESGELADTSRRHAAFYCDLLDRSVVNTPGQPERPARERLSNVRAALEWAFSDLGDTRLGTELAARSAQLFLDLSLLGECRLWTQRALSVLDASLRGTSSEMALRLAFGQALMFSQGNSEEAHASLARALEIAESLDDSLGQFRLLCGMHMYHRRRGDFAALVSMAEKAAAIATDFVDPVAVAAAYSMLGVSHHLNGNLAPARDALWESIQQPTDDRRVTTKFFGADRDAPILIPRTLWQMGFPDQAAKAALEAGDIANLDPVTGCVALIGSASVFHLMGEWEAVEDYVDHLIQHAGEHSLAPYQSVGLGFRGEVMFRRGEVEAGVNLVREALNRLRAARYENYSAWLSCTLAEGLAARRHYDQALALIGELTAPSANTAVYNMPELLRVRGDLLAQAGDEKAAERSLEDAIAIAEAQGALSWRLRAATSLARLWRSHGRSDAAGELLGATYARFSEGFCSADLLAAKALLEALGRPPEAV
ncbi:OmpR/PhoB-type domain-containing protein [Hyphomicrobiales bacterium]|jgi:predicted ATPase/DNA-binding winged helix-turn-helix (wHTH) protein|uniref:ATP-binding protein n=2 Tax=Hyphomicrobiales TaxID=356 RepID=UPI001DF81585|nr:winged helix-turn-helix domain-containing protein [Parvibaculum sp.]MBX3491221.1 winged helix-turn-helix domain-containing protein [Parvibaculum sp.]CAH1662692.1 OmpR/PhoB-type domain-containing protein [Hyphomicrobiales bacterium]CAH1682577.1 OmpR/PhoB-type domain-containing protein [Hyphomicrobiales bacterium]